MKLDLAGVPIETVPAAGQRDRAKQARPRAGPDRTAPADAGTRPRRRRPVEAGPADLERPAVPSTSPPPHVERRRRRRAPPPSSSAPAVVERRPTVPPTPGHGRQRERDVSRRVHEALVVTDSAE